MFCFLVSQCRNLNRIGWCLYYLCIHAFELSKHTSPTMIYFLCLFLSRLFFFFLFFSFLFFLGFLIHFCFQLTEIGVCSVGNLLYFPWIPQVYVLFCSVGNKRLCLSLFFTF